MERVGFAMDVLALPHSPWLSTDPDPGHLEEKAQAPLPTELPLVCMKGLSCGGRGPSHCLWILGDQTSSSDSVDILITPGLKFHENFVCFSPPKSLWGKPNNFGIPHGCALFLPMPVLHLLA